MNLEEEIISYLDKQNYDDLTKIRWIYLYVSSKFTYDIRFYLGNSKDKEIIYNKKIDIKKVEEFEIICYTIANILIDALSLIGVKGELVREKEKEFTHVYVKVVHKNKVIKLDPMKRHDNTRIKMNSQTLDFSSLIDDPMFEDELKEADSIIQYPNTDKKEYPEYYNDKAIKNIAETIEKEAREKNWSQPELFFKKIEMIKTLINQRKDFTRYDDMDYYMGYLIKKFEINTPYPYFKPILFYKINEDRTFDVINIILIDYPNLPPIFYIMKKETNNYIMKELNYQEVSNYLNEYDSIYRNYFETILRKHKDR